MTKKTKKDEEERDYQRLVEQETLIFEATELLSELIEESGENRKELADKLNRSKGFVTQILAGDRNMTLRTLADFAFALEHRVKVKAAPLVECGDGGEAMGEQGQATARVRVGAAGFFTPPERAEAGDAPRRSVAAEGHNRYLPSTYAHATYVNARIGNERAELLLMGVTDEMETVT